MTAMKLIGSQDFHPFQQFFLRDLHLFQRLVVAQDRGGSDLFRSSPVWIRTRWLG